MVENVDKHSQEVVDCLPETIPACGLHGPILSLFSRWCRLAAVGFRAAEGDPDHLASPIPEDAGLTSAHAKK